MENSLRSKKICLSPGETASALGVSRNHLYKYLDSGELKSFKLGHRRLINQEALDDFRTSLEQQHFDQIVGGKRTWGARKWK